MQPHLRSAGWFVVATLLFAPSCSRDDSSSSPPAAAERPFWVDFKRPAYADVELATLEGPLLEDIESGEDDFRRAQREFANEPRFSRHAMPSGREAVIWKDVNAAYFAYRMGELQLYRQHTRDPQLARGAAERFIEAYLRLAARQPGAVGSEDVLALGKAALSQGSNDPLVRVYVARQRIDGPERPQAYDELLAAIDDLRAVPYHPRTECLARQYLLALESERGSLQPAILMRTYDAIDAAVRLLESAAEDEQPRFAWWQITDLYQKLDREKREDLLVACLQSGKVRFWHRHMLLGKYYRDLAWEHRGPGFAREVTDEGWLKFREYLPRAAKHYIRAWQLHPDQPEAASAMVSIANAGGGEGWTPRDWFQQAVAAQLDEERAYDRLIWAMTPRWGGSHRQMLSFAAECLDTGRWDTNVPSQSISVLSTIRQEFGSERPFGQYPGAADVAAQFAEGLRSALAESPETCCGDTPGNWAFVAGLLLQAGRDEEAQRTFDQFGDRLTQRDFDWAGMKLPYARGLASARTGPARKQVVPLQEFIESSHDNDIPPPALDGIFKLLRQAREADPRPQSEDYFREVAAVLDQLRAFHSGEWVDLPFDENLSGWYAFAEETELADDGTLRLASTPARFGVQLVPLARFRAPILIEAEVASWPGKPVGRSIGVMHGSGDGRSLYARSPMRGVFVGGNWALSHLYDTSDHTRYDRMGWAIDPGPFHLLRIKVWPESLAYYADRRQLETQKDVFDWSSGAFAIGDMLPADRPNSFQVRNVRVRRLDHGPPPSLSDRERWREFYQAERDLDPRDPQPYLLLAIERYYAGESQAALELLEQAREGNPEMLQLDYYTGAALLALHRYREAVPFYERAIQKDADHMRAHSNLAWILAAAPLDDLRDGRRARELAQRACELKNYEDWQPLCALAAAHAELGQFEEAAKWIEKSLELAPENQEEWMRGNREAIQRGRPLRIDPKYTPQESPPVDSDAV